MKHSSEFPINRSMPSAAIVPVLHYPDVRAAADWLCRAFGFSERLRIGDHRAQLSFGAGAVVVAAGTACGGASVMVRVEDVDAHHRQALSCGTQILQSPADHPYGERQYTAQDPAGHDWTFSQSIADVDPESWGATVTR